MGNTKERDYGLDNIKSLLIVLVVLGHILEEISMKGSLGLIRCLIYSFHMPMFIFVSGYFSKKDIESKTLIQNYLIPYFIFNTIWMILHGKLNILTPLYVFWYLLSLFLWKTFAKYFVKIRGILLFSVLLSLYIGCFVEADRFLSISRTISFLPFFMAGVLCKEAHLENVRRMKKRYSIVLIAISTTIIVFIYQNQIIPIKMFEYIQSYEATSINNLEGIFMRGTMLILASILILAILNLVPVKFKKTTIIGQYTITIYLLHVFIIKSMFWVVDRTYIMKLLQNNSMLALSGALVVCVLIITICTNKKVVKIYQILLDRVALCILK